MKNDATKEVVVVLPYSGNKVLMQLRDLNPEIIFPGSWAFFGGSIHDGETPYEAAQREFLEEAGYNVSGLHKVSVDFDLGYLLIHAYACELTIPFESLVLNEGLDFALFSLPEVMRGNLYSERLKKEFPVAGTPYIIYIIKKLLAKVEAK